MKKHYLNSGGKTYFVIEIEVPLFIMSKLNIKKVNMLNALHDFEITVVY